MAASREEVYERVKEVLTEQLGIEEADITEEASFQEDLDADSLDLVELIMELEDQFGIKISDEDAQKIRPSARPSTTSLRTSSRGLRPRAADRRAPAGAGGARLHAYVWASDRGASYERLEFLGDSVLELAVAHALYARHPDFSEGQLAKVRSHVVSRATCAEVARELEPRGAPRRAGGSDADGGGARAAVARTATCSRPSSRRRSARSSSQHGFAAIEERDRRRVLGSDRAALTTRVDHKTDLQELLARTGPPGEVHGDLGRGAAARASLHVRRARRRRGARSRRGADEEGGRAGGRARGAREARRFPESYEFLAS